MHLRHHPAVADGCMPVCREWQKALHSASTLHNSSWCPAVLLPLSFRFLALACSFSCSPHTLIYTHAPIHTLTHPHAHTHTNTYTLICTLHTCVYDVPFCPFNRYLMHSVCLQWFPHLRAPLFLSSAQSELDELYRARQLPV